MHVVLLHPVGPRMQTREIGRYDIRTVPANTKIQTLGKPTDLATAYQIRPGKQHLTSQADSADVGSR
jgi:hypothetical protein